MVFNIVIPEINSKPKNSKDAIISLLMTEWPLSLKQIYYRIKKQYGYSNSYQSVYKAVKELIEKKVLIEKKEGYEINIGWVKKVQSFTDIVETNYYAQKRFQDIAGVKESRHAKDLIILSFNSLFDAEKYLYYFIKTELLKKRNKTICYQIKDEWRPLFYLRAEYNYFKKLMRQGHKFYFLHENDSPLEQIAKKFYKYIGIKLKTSKQEIATDTIILEEYFIQIFVPENLRIKIRKYLEKKDTMKLLEVLNTPKDSSIKVIINKDPSLAKELKKKLLKSFK